ncbi:MAG: hypothetical protein M3Y37_01045 [Chloroflexota bacterium]|jgi:hypothetical protein|nr:hypothetical protein [Chloroflexota bacterium]
MSTATISTSSGPTAGDVRISDLSNDSLIIRLHFTINHLSRWLTPVHDLDKLNRVVYRNQPSIKELVIRMRQEERRVFPMLHLMANENDPDLDRLPEPVITPEQAAIDNSRSVLSAMAEFRRLRQSTCSLLRSLPDSGWQRVGTSRKTHDWQIRSLAEALVAHDEAVLTEIDLALERYGIRNGIAEHGRARLYELLKLIPVTTRNWR